MSKDYSLFRCWTTLWVLGDFGAVNVTLPTDLPTADFGFDQISRLKMSPFIYFLVYTIGVKTHKSLGVSFYD